jgi:eukaryotic-like serine/threonine-protein kinase
MATASKPSGPVILFTHEGLAYEYREHLGVGPHGEALLLAYQRTADEVVGEVVLKCLGLPPGSPSAATQRGRARLEEEVRLARYLSHGALVRVLFQHETPEALYTAHERVPSPPLDALVALSLERKKAVSEAFLLHVGAELASALAHVHTRVDEQGQPLGIVHRNISPSTILFTWRGTVRLGDLSLAYSNLDGRWKSSVRRPRPPLFFSAPETLLRGQVDARSDLFALGLVLLELGTGRHLYDPPYKTLKAMEDSLPWLERRHVRREVRAAQRVDEEEMLEQAFWGAASFTPADVERMAAGLAAPLKSLLERLLQRDPAERFQTAAEVKEALRARLAVVGPYGAAEAVAEIDKMVIEVGEALVAEEVNPRLLPPALVGERASPQDTTR